MQYKIIALAAAALAAVSLAGCGAPAATENSPSSPAVVSEAPAGETSAEETPSAAEGESGTTLDEDDQAVVGTWQMTENTIGGAAMDVSEVQTVYIFHDDGTFEMLLNGDPAGEGSFAAEGTKITFDIGGGENELRLEGDRLIAETETADGLSVSVFSRAQN